MMQDEDQTAGIIEFSEDISTQEAPVPLPTRKFPATIRKVEPMESKSGKGTRYAAVHFYISPDDYPADYPLENAPEGVTLVYRRLTLDDSPQSRYRIRKFCETVGAPCGKRIDLNQWINLTASIELKHETFEGETRAVVDKVLRA